MEPLRRWCRMTAVFPDGRPSRTDALEGLGSPDLRAVDQVARRALAALREGGRLVLDHVDPDLEDLVRLAALPVEVQRQPEGGE